MAREMSEYERRRAENIARNAEILAKLGVADAGIGKTPARSKTKGIKGANKRPRYEPVVLRRSLRTRGVAPETDITKLLEADNNISKKSELDSENVPWEEDSVSFSKVAAAGEAAENVFCRRIVDYAKLAHREDAGQAVDSLKFTLDSSDVVKLVPDRIFSLSFVAFREKPVLIAGDKTGNLGIWDAEAEEDELRVYRPHRSPVSGIAASSCDATKIITCSYDGFVLVMDMEKMAFSRIHSAENELTALYHHPSVCGPSIYVAEGEGEFKAVDPRKKDASCLAKLHARRINTIDFNTQRPHLFVTSSTDATVFLWDIRNIKRQKSLATLHHDRAVSSAYFSPSGTHVASTSYDNHIGLWTMEPGKDEMKEQFMISHNNQTNRWISTLRAIWSFSDDYLFIANMSRAIDIISPRTKATVACLRSEDMTSIPCRLAQHQLAPHLLAGAAAGGKVFLWKG